MNNYWIGSTKILVHNIDEAKEWVTEIQDKLDNSKELSNKITDFFFSIEADYQSYHNLDEDNWDMVH